MLGSVKDGIEQKTGRNSGAAVRVNGVPTS